MNINELVETNIWSLYQKHVNFMRSKNYFSSTDKNFKFYNDNQWDGVIVGNMEPISINYIKPIVKYKTSVLTAYDYSIIYSSENHETEEFKETAKVACELLNKKVRQACELNKIDKLIKRVARKSAINGESIAYFYPDEEKLFKTELKSKVDVMYGNENESDIQEQPYILLKRRKTVLETREYAKQNNVSEDLINSIHGDNFTQDESGANAKDEVDDMCTIVTFLYKKDGTIHSKESVKYVDIIEDQDTGLTYYPLAHLNWEECEGNARGIGEVEQHIANQIEVNKTATRRAFVGKTISYPFKVVNIDKIANPEDINKVGATIQIKDGNTEDVSNFFKITTPGHMSPDVAQLQNELITVSRELAGAGDSATGQIDPTEASGKAILAVQRASEQPLNEQSDAVKDFIEDIGRIIYDIIKTYSDQLIVVDDSIDPATGEVNNEIKVIQKSVLEQLKLNIRIDITPKSSYDRYAQEASLENLSQSELFLPQNQQLLEDYVSLLDDDSTMPKSKLLELLKRRKERQQQVELIEQQAMLLKQQANQQVANSEDIENIANIGNDLLNQNVNQATA